MALALGTYCKALGIDEEVLNGQKEKVCEVKSICNGIMWELKKYKTAKKLTTKELVDWLIKIFQLKCENTEVVQEKIDKKLENLTSVRTTILKAPQKYRGELERLMKWSFDFPVEAGMEPTETFEPTVCANLGPKLLKVLKEKGGTDDDSVDMSGDDDDEQAKKRKAREEIVQLKKDLGSAKKIVTSLNDKMLDINNRCQILSDLSKSSVSECRRIESDILNLKSDWSSVMINWHDCMERLNHVNNNKSSYLDVGYMVRRNKTKQGIFDELSFEFERTLEEFKYKINSLVEKERKKKKVVSREYRQKSKTDRKRVRQEDDNPEEAKKPCLTEDSITAPNSISMNVEEFMKSEKIDEFKGGKFGNALRVIYIELTSMSVPCTNVHEIIFKVLDELEPLNTDKLPTSSFAGNIYMETRMAAALQAFSDLLKKSKISICNDGNLKCLWESPNYNITLADESCLTLGIRDLVNGSPDTSFKSLKNLISEVTSFKMDNPISDVFANAAKTEFNLLDRIDVETLFIYKQKISPSVASNIDSLSDPIQSKVMLVNNFFTGIYFLYGLAKLADITAFTWESLASGLEVGSLNSSNDMLLSKIVNEVHTFSVLLDPELIQETEVSAELDTFIKKNKKIDSTPLASYKKNTFNLVFHNTAAVWFYYETNLIADFLESIKENEKCNSKPLSSLFQDKHSLAMIRTLGILGKLVIVPMWTVLEDDTTEINIRYSSMLQKIEIWAKDASKLMKGQEKLFADVPVSHDAVYISLIKDNENTDALTKELLEVFLTAFGSYIKSACEKKDTSDMETDIKPTVYKDFTSFDQITINIHSLSTFAQDALVLYCKTRNGEWQDKLYNIEGKQISELIENDYNNHLKTLYRRKLLLREKVRQDSKKTNIVDEKYNLIDDLIKCGGLWKTENEVDSHVKDMSGNDRLNALRAQIRFRRKVLGEKHEGGLLDLAFEGRCFSDQKLCENLKTILKKEIESSEVDVFELGCSSEDETKRKELIEICKKAPLLTCSKNNQTSVNTKKEQYNYLLGKMVLHKINFEKEETLNGVVIAKETSSECSSFIIRYKNKGIFKVPGYKISEDIAHQKFRVIDPPMSDLKNFRLSRAFIKDDGELEWLDCKVVGCTYKVENFVIEFEYFGSRFANISDLPEFQSFTFTSKLLEEYRIGHLRIL